MTKLPFTSKEEMLDSNEVAKYCDRSPCPGMLEALGRWVFGDETGGFTAVTGRVDLQGMKHLDKIKYCPFCGTALSQLNLAAREVISLPSPH